VVWAGPEVVALALTQMLGQHIGDQRPGDDVDNHCGNTRPTAAPHLLDRGGAEDLAPKVMAEEPPDKYDDDPGYGEVDEDDGERHQVALGRQVGQVDVKDAAVMFGNADFARGTRRMWPLMPR